MKFFKNLATYTNKYLHRRDSLLYIEIKNDALTLTLFSRKKNALKVINTTEIKLENNEYVHENIFNPTAIHQHIKNYIHQQDLHKPKTLISLPEYEKIGPEKQKMAILQTALCVAKSPLYIEAICKEQLSTNTQPILFAHYLEAKKTDLLIPFKHYNQHSPITWLLRTSLAAGILVTILACIQTSEQHKYKIMHQELEIISSQTDKLKEKVQALHDIQDEISYFQSKIELINNLSHTIHNPLKLLLALSRSMPEHTFITHLTINPTQKEKPNTAKTTQNRTNNTEALTTPSNTKAQEEPPSSIIVNIEGIARETEEITILLSNLANQSNLEDLSILKIKKIKKRLKSQSNTPNGQYYFRIAGHLE